MNMRSTFACPTLMILLLACILTPAGAENWPSWRGPRGDGTSLEKNLPLRWNDPAVLRWKTPLPGFGHASPIVWGDRIFTVTALEATQERQILCLDAVTGKILWQKTVLKAPLEKKHNDNSYASGTPATDGEKVVVTFLDGPSIAVAAYDFAGQQLWLVRPGTFEGPWGLNSSPVLFQDEVIINGGSKGPDSFLAALSQKDGHTLWKIPQPTHNSCYSTPLIRELAGRTQCLMAADKSVSSYDPKDGKRLWFVEGPSDEFVASIVYNERAGLLLAGSSWPKQLFFAIKPDGQGNVTQTKVAWRSPDNTSANASPIAVGDYFIGLDTPGNATCYDAASGKILWKQRVGSHHASPIAADGLVYLLSDAGQVRVIKPGPAYECVAQYDMGEKFFASPVVSGGRIFLRGYQNLYCIAPR